MLTIVAQWGFERARKAPELAHASANPEQDVQIFAIDAPVPIWNLVVISRC